MNIYNEKNNNAIKLRALEGYRVLHKLGSKDEAVRKLLSESKKENKK